MHYGVKAQRGWLESSMPVGSITAGPKSITRTVGAANLHHDTTASANQPPFHNCKSAAGTAVFS